MCPRTFSKNLSTAELWPRLRPCARAARPAQSSWQWAVCPGWGRALHVRASFLLTAIVICSVSTNQ